MKALVLLTLTILLVACQGGYVDKSSPSFVDKTPAGGIDTGLHVELPSNDTVTNQSEAKFIPPPANYTQNTTISIAEKQSFVGKNAVKLWVWNDKGSQALLMAEGSTVTIPKLGVSVEILIISNDDGRVKVLINDVPAKALGLRQETKVGDTWVFISDLFLNK